MPFTNNMDRKSGPTKRWALSSIHIVWYPASVFAENWLYCVGLLELCGYINFVIFTNCSRTFEGTVYTFITRQLSFLDSDWLRARRIWARIPRPQAGYMESNDVASIFLYLIVNLENANRYHSFSF